MLNISLFISSDLVIMFLPQSFITLTDTDFPGLIKTYCILLPYYSSLAVLFSCCSPATLDGLNSWLTWQCPERRWAKDRLQVSEERILECHRAVKAENPFFQPSCPIIATNHTFFLVDILANIRVCLMTNILSWHSKCSQRSLTLKQDPEACFLSVDRSNREV